MGRRFTTKWRYARRAAAFFGFDVDKSTFTPGMAKRATSVFAAAPIVQGKWDGSGASDALSFSRGSQVADLFYDNFDPYQGTISFWWIPEKDRDATQTDDEYLLYNNVTYIRHEHNTNKLRVDINGNGLFSAALTITAGTIYHIVVRWKAHSFIDGTNHVAISINDSHTFGVTATMTGQASAANLSIGSYNSGTSKPANAIIEGLCISREIWFDGTYGTDLGQGDVINKVWAAGVGADPTLFTGSWGTTLMVPTDATPGALTTGSTDAWSHPHSSAVLDDTFLTSNQTPGTTLEFDGADTLVNCGSDASLDNLANGTITAESWIKLDGYGESGAGRIFEKIESAGGWMLTMSSTKGVYALIRRATTKSVSRSLLTPIPANGSWYHVAMTFDVSSYSVARIWINGIEQTDTETAGAGAANVDSALDLHIGNSIAGSNTFDGSIAWLRISDNIRYTADFIPPSISQPPAVDGNTVEQWNLNEGTGATASAEVAGANDGTITSGTWAESWESEGSPVTPKSVVFDGAATAIAISDAVSIQDLQDDALTVEAWIRADGWGLGDIGYIAAKGGDGKWYFRVRSGDGIRGNVACATTDADSRSGIDDFSPDSIWHHAVMFFDDAGDRKVHLAVDGIWVTSYSVQVTGVGAITSDVGQDLAIGSRLTIGSNVVDGAIAWVRISDNDRYAHGTDFTPPSRTVPPANDANTVSLWRMEEGAGATVADANANGNDGTITSGSWDTVIDMATDAPGDRMFNWGYTVAGITGDLRDEDDFGLLDEAGASILEE